MDAGQREQKRKCALNERAEISRDHCEENNAGMMNKERTKALRVLVKYGIQMKTE